MIIKICRMDSYLCKRKSILIGWCLRKRNISAKEPPHKKDLLRGKKYHNRSSKF